MSDFWARKLAQQQKQLTPYDLASASGKKLVPDRPWWQMSSGTPNNVPEQEVSPQGYIDHRGKRKVKLTDDIEIELDEDGEYRPKKASHLKTAGGRCPDCDSPNFGRGQNKSAAMRCFDCGYVEGRNIADANRPIGISSNAPSQRSRQITTMNVLDATGRPLGVTTAASGLQSNYHGPSKEGTMSGRDVLTHINGV